MSFLIPSLKDRARALADAMSRREQAVPEQRRAAQQALVDALGQPDDQRLLMATQAYLAQLNPQPGQHFFSDFNSLCIQIRDQVTQPAKLTDNVFPYRLKTALYAASEQQFPDASPAWKDMFKSRLEQPSSTFTWREASHLDDYLVQQQQREEQRQVLLTAIRQHAQTVTPALHQAQAAVLNALKGFEPLDMPVAAFMAQLDPTPGQSFHMHVADVYTQGLAISEGRAAALGNALFSAYQQRFPHASHQDKWDFGTVVEIQARWGSAEACWQKAHLLDQEALTPSPKRSLAQAVQSSSSEKQEAETAARAALVKAVMTDPKQVERAAQVYLAHLDSSPGGNFFQTFNAFHIQVRDQQGRVPDQGEAPVFSEATQAALLRAYTTAHPHASAVARAHFEQVLAQGPALSWRAAMNLDEDVNMEAKLGDLTTLSTQGTKGPTPTGRRRVP